MEIEGRLLSGTDLAGGLMGLLFFKNGFLFPKRFLSIFYDNRINGAVGAHSLKIGLKCCLILDRER